jgi:ABC-2 type transport system ATP-binding protein
VLELRGVSKRYGSVQALNECAFRAATGRLTGFVGPNGAGKTTAMRVIFGLVSPDSGEARWNGRAIDASVRRRFGYMPEERGLYPRMRVRDQLPSSAGCPAFPSRGRGWRPTGGWMHWD